ncbi:TlpA family protein disulfide reductase [Botrimarina hoheduenensis]|uniref:Thiol-disulfide oxidoreductase ResA n=1 Tax=Botrimarina hoheduenensis TaxID=2528000 RepID=A0A5C5WE69_9BACT|nr:TlpA disulfide reductase family protein [Botrimarina hoheduenensis]TWT48359.1 Thiol-disulfide oxidoreductase ResA [Botrimarina hoheduenensis]
MHRFTLTLLLVAIGPSLGDGTAMGQTTFNAPRSASAGGGPAAEPTWSLPSNPLQWLNSPPLTAESLTGKGVVLYFFDETCPRCAEAWPQLQNLAASYEGKPVVFIAINSGTPPHDVQQYARRRRVQWPLIIDTDRSFERSMGVNEISLSNVNQIRTVSATGQLGNGAIATLKNDIDSVLKGAAWRVDPTQVLIPPALRESWYLVELGGFARAARGIQRAKDSRDVATKTAAEALIAAVDSERKKDQTKVDEDNRQRKSWEAYKRLEIMSLKYDGYEMHAKIVEQLDGLADNKSVSNEIRAQRALESALRTASKGNGVARRRAAGMLEKLVERDPKTEAAATARELIAQLAIQR